MSVICFSVFSIISKISLLSNFLISLVEVVKINKVLSKNSTFNSKPELEIYADDVKCSHGSTTGNIDQNSVFYLMSRGISKEQANKMIVEGFLNEIIESITDYDVKTLISKEINERINKIQF